MGSAPRLHGGAGPGARLPSRVGPVASGGCGSPAGWVGLLVSFSPPLAPASTPSSQPHSQGWSETAPPSAAPLPRPRRRPANEHLCLAFNGPVLLSPRLPARVVDVVGSVL